MFGKYVTATRKQAPLVHNITNYVTVNDVANIILACGASPIMADCREEAADITAICAGLCLNIGTLNENTIPSMLLAGKKAGELKHPVVLDPVGVGASPLRTETALKICREVPLTAIRGNVSELKGLALGSGDTQGVDAAPKDAVGEENLDAAVTFAKEAAKKLKAVVAITGAIDLVSSGEKCYVLRNGRAEMGRITGTGCQLSALVASFLAASPDEPLEAVAAAVAVMGVAGEIAWQNMAATDGNATYRNRIIDAVYNLTPEVLTKEARYEIR
ncbi:MAG: hydroxyethylthiazole kinase [Selenomonadaceae bacterium]|nr:hydroxyethylthiazole kinase [Selenomonadaceae bacterium]